MPTTRLRLAAALVSLTALTGCHHALGCSLGEPWADCYGGSAGASNYASGGRIDPALLMSIIQTGAFQPSSNPVPFYPMVIPTSQPRGFSCSAVGNTTHCY